jgi:hypothetical protein
MADRNEKYRQKLIEACQPHVEEPIVAIGQFQPGGAAGAMGVMMGVSGAAGMVMRSSSKKNAGGLPHIGLYALTATTLHVFDGKPKGFGFKIKKLVASFPRDGFRAERGEGKVTDKVTLVLADGEQINLESMKGGGGFNDEIINAMIAGPTA